jgi:flavin reductase (DIM6/NTAB) family NADH-FMN oxidoreductase RutF
MEVDMSSLRTRDVYAWLTSVIVPRPIAWVSTLNGEGQPNLAPYSYFSGLASSPPLVTLGIANLRDGSPKDTLRNAQESGVLCINVVEESLVEQMNQTSGAYPPEVNEFQETGLTSLACTKIDCVRVKGSRVSMECRLVDVHPYGNGPGVNLVVAEVVFLHVDDEVLEEGMVADDRLRPVARLGGTAYASVGKTFHLPRPKV